MGKTRRLAAGKMAAVLSAISLAAHAAPVNSRLNREPLFERQNVIAAEWERGICSIRDSVLTYMAWYTYNSITLDVSVQNPKTLLCSAEFTVEIGTTSAVAAVGANRILSNIEYLGNIGDVFLLANSYAINLDEPAQEGIANSRLEDTVLAIETRAERTWKLDLTNPKEWNIY